MAKTIVYALERYKLVEQLESSNKELENFAFVASHDLKEPLRKVINFGGRLRDKYSADLDERGQEYMDIMIRASERMQEMIEALLTYSRVSE